MRRILLAALCGLWAGPVWAQQQVAIYPPMFTGQGIMSMAQATTPVSASNVTLTNTKGTPFPQYGSGVTWMVVKNLITSGGNLNVCWSLPTSGSCTATNGELLAPGESRTKALAFFYAAPPQVYCAAGTCSVEVEWP